MTGHEVVKYHNDLNSTIMRGWSSVEMNFFFAIIAKVRDKGIESVEFSTAELKELSNFGNEHKCRWEDTMISAAEKILKLSYIEHTRKKISLMTLFSKFDVYPEEKKIEVQFTQNFEYIVNKLTRNFTTYELADFTQIRSTYAKTMYRILKQWKTQGRKEFKFDDFKLLLDMPKYYTPSQIDKNVLAPIMRELPSFFENLKVKKVKSNKRGNPVIAYEFTWEAEQTEVYIPGKFHHTQKKKAFTERPYDHESVVAQQQKDIEEMFGKDFDFSIEKLKLNSDKVNEKSDF